MNSIVRPPFPPSRLRILLIHETGAKLTTMFQIFCFVNTNYVGRLPPPFKFGTSEVSLVPYLIRFKYFPRLNFYRGKITHIKVVRNFPKTKFCPTFSQKLATQVALYEQSGLNFRKKRKVRGNHSTCTPVFYFTRSVFYLYFLTLFFWNTPGHYNLGALV